MKFFVVVVYINYLTSNLANPSFCKAFSYNLCSLGSLCLFLLRCQVQHNNRTINLPCRLLARLRFGNVYLDPAKIGFSVRHTFINQRYLTFRNIVSVPFKVVHCPKRG